MSKKRKSTRYRLISPEYDRMPEGKEVLAQRIAAQRYRLLEERQERLEAQSAQGSEHGGAAMALAATVIEAAPAYAVEFAKKKPVLALLIGAGALIAVPWAVKRIGAKRLMRGANALSPLWVEYLSRNRCD